MLDYFTDELYEFVRSTTVPQLPDLQTIKSDRAGTGYDYYQYNGRTNRRTSNREHLGAACAILDDAADPAILQEGASEPCDLTASNSDTPNVVRMCNSCHVTGDMNAPFIDLSHPEALSSDQKRKIAERLAPDIGRGLRMPPDRNLTHRERRTLRKFLFAGSDE